MQSEEDDIVSPRYKEELCMSLLEASMITRDRLSDDVIVLDAWLLASVETAEICSKVLDWKIKNSSIGE